MEITRELIGRIMGIAITLAIFAGLWWLGLKGIIGMLVGMGIMAFVFLTKNPTVQATLALIFNFIDSPPWHKNRKQTKK